MKYPFIRQRDLKDCGVCSLLMITRYFGGSVSIEYLRDITHTTKSGVNAYDLVNGAKKLGFNGYGVRGDISNLNQQDLPVIAHVVKRKSLEHFIVIYKINKKKKAIIVADPANNHLTKMTFTEFSKISTNNFIILKPYKKIILNEKNAYLKSFIHTKLRENKKSFIAIFLLSILIIMSQIILSFNFKMIMDEILVVFSKNNLILLSIILLLLVLLKELSNYTRSKYINMINHDLNISLSSKVYNHILSLPYLYYKNRTTGEVTARMNDLESIKDLISRCIITCIIDSLLIIGSLVTLFILCPILTLMVFIMMIVIISIILIFNKPIDNEISNAKSYAGEVNSYLVETINGIETIKHQNIVPFIKKKFKILYSNFNVSSYKYNNLFIIFTFIKSLILEIGNLIILCFGSYLVVLGDIKLSTLITFITLSNYIFSPINTITELILTFREAKISYIRIKELYEVKEENINNRYKEINGLIDIKHLSYSYNNRDLLLKDINIDIKPGEKVLIYGNSGSGKSTLAKIITGELEANNNCIKIDDKSIKRYNISNLRKDICYISSNDTLFTDSVYNNIVLDREENNFDDVVKLCLVDEFIEKKNLAYDFLLEENGFNLSGGQKQRILLARSILKNSNIYILDEALNQVDIKKERIILENLFNKYPNKTFIYISHRFNNNDLFDKEYKIEDGVSYIGNI